MKREEDFQTQSGNSSAENTYANLKDLKAKEPENNPKAKDGRRIEDWVTVFLIVFLIVVFFILVIFTSLVFVYYDKIRKEVSQLTNSDTEILKKEMNYLKNLVQECNSKFENKLEQHKNETKPSCKSGWLEFDGHCYFFYNFELNWTRAEMMCLNRESHLVVITSQAEQDFLLQHLDGKIYWIGLTDVVTEGAHQWVDGTLLSFKFWNIGEPNDFGRKEDCIVLSQNDKWNDNQCDTSQYAICEKSL